jgi:subtilisin family serine protease
VQAQSQDYVPNQVVVLYKMIGSRSAEFDTTLAEPQLVTLEPGETVEAALARLHNDPNIELAEPNFLVRTTQGRWKTENATLNWGLNRVGAPKAWKAFVDNGGSVTEDAARVCVIDSGIDCRHPDLKDRCTDGINMLTKKRGLRAAADDNGHGTQVAGVVAASANGGGVIGIAPSAQLLSCKFMNEDGIGTTFDANRCLQWCLNSSAAISVNAWGSDSEGGAQASDILKRTLTSPRGRRHLFVTSAGNGNKLLGPGGSEFYPAMLNLSNMLVVGATNRLDRPGIWGNSGTNYDSSIVDLGAPGVSIITTDYSALSSVANDWYRSVSGSSIATGFVGGAAALLAQANPDASMDAVKSWIIEGAERRANLRRHFTQGVSFFMNVAFCSRFFC